MSEQAAGAGADIDYSMSADGVDWVAFKEALIADAFDNRRTPEELERSFGASHAVVFAWGKGRVVGSARVLSDGVCNAYLLDVWTDSSFRRRGVASTMVRRLLGEVPGQHVALFTEHARELYESLGFTEERVGMSKIEGLWLGRYPPRPNTD